MKLMWDFQELYDFAEKLTDERLEKTFERVTKEIAEVLLKYMRGFTPKETGQLIDGWNDNAFLVKAVNDGYEVEIVNKTEYALWVNDGHRAFNQYGGPYEIHNRVKVKVPHEWQKGDYNYHVFGHFFVERGIAQFTNTTEIEKIIMNELHKWWKGCF